MWVKLVRKLLFRGATSDPYYSLSNQVARDLSNTLTRTPFGLNFDAAPSNFTGDSCSFSPAQPRSEACSRSLLRGCRRAVMDHYSPLESPSSWRALPGFQVARSTTCSPLTYSPNILSHSDDLPFDSVFQTSSSPSEYFDALQSPESTTEIPYFGLSPHSQGSQHFPSQNSVSSLPLLLKPDDSVFAAAATQYYQDLGHDAKSRSNDGIGLEPPMFPAFKSMILALGDEALSDANSLQIPVVRPCIIRVPEPF